MHYKRRQREKQKGYYKESEMKNIIIISTLLGTTMCMAENQALVIGCCSNYKLEGIPLLGGTENDARYIKNLLQSREVKPKNIDYLVEEDATFKNITEKLKAKEFSNLKRGDTLYVYYSGHGTSTGDEGVFSRKLTSNKDILKRLNNSAGLIPYDFDIQHPKDTLIITSRDFKPTFKKLDDRGINIVWIADACYAGNAYRSLSGIRSKFITINKDDLGWTPPRGQTTYKNLIFYGASISTMVARETKYKGEARGAFSVELVNCLNKNYGTSTISNKDLKKCLEKNYSNFVFDSSVYPIDNRLDTKEIIAAPAKNSSSEQNMTNTSFKQKLFSLQNNTTPLKLNIYSEDAPNLTIDTFCLGEMLDIDLQNPTNNLAVFTMDSANKIIMLYPNRNSKSNQKLKQIIRTEVQYPVGTDKVKVFSIADTATYTTIWKYKNKEAGVLSSSDVETIYDALNKSKKFQSALVQVKTIKTPVNECRKGDI